MSVKKTTLIDEMDTSIVEFSTQQIPKPKKNKRTSRFRRLSRLYQRLCNNRRRRRKIIATASTHSLPRR